MNIASRPWDIAAVLVYVAAMLGLGLYLARRASAAENYFVGRRDFPGWAVALSMLGTIISSTRVNPGRHRFVCMRPIWR